MKNLVSLYTAILIAAFLSGQAFADENAIIRLLSLPEEKIDVGKTALIIAKDIYPEIDVNAYSAKIDAMVSNVRILTKGSSDPDYRIRALNTYLYKIVGIKYDFSDPFGKNTKNRYINGVLDSKRGNCVSIPILYLAIAQRLGYPVYAVAAPEHLFLRYVDPIFKDQNIEATGGGGYSSDKEYIKNFQISKAGIKSGTYLKTMSHRALVADMVSQLAGYWIEKGDFRRAIRYLEKCVKISPNSAEINSNLGKSYWLYGKTMRLDEAYEYFRKGDFYFKKGKALGLVKLPQEDYIAEVKRKAMAEAIRNKGGNNE
ncbi:MAG: hypothetical protein HY035_03130 [Nitrospirae bacterium]|nr:hypothetical protein [Nitrospirota bacterium]